MGLLDRVKASQTGVTPAAPATNGPPPPSAPVATATNPPAPTQTAPPQPPPGGGLAARQAARSTSGEAPVPGLSPAFTAAKVQVHARLLEKYADQLDVTDREGVKAKITELAEDYFRTNTMTLTKMDRERLIESLMDDVLGLGPLEPLVNDAEISEIMINHPKQIYVERKGVPMLSNVTFENSRQLMLVIDRIVSSIGRRVDESTPMCDARLKDGSRVNVIIPPLALKGPCMTIRKFSKDKLGPNDLLRFGSATPQMIQFLQSCVRARLNVLVSGGTGSGKTTLLNILSQFIPAEERIITCEDAAELQLQQDHVITLESRPANVEGKGAIPIRDLVKNCLRMRPDRIIVGECRGGEALDMLQAMNTGHDGSMSTIHANNPHECLGRLETLVLMAGSDLPSRAIREQMASAIHLIVQQQRLRGGPRKIVSIAEITGIEQGEIHYQEIFTFKQVGVNEQGKAVGYHTATGIKPMRLDHLKASGEEVPESIFAPAGEPSHDKLY
jgi:pilus assembly protein CpaF